MQRLDYLDKVNFKRAGSLINEIRGKIGTAEVKTKEERIEEQLQARCVSEASKNTVLGKIFRKRVQTQNRRRGALKFAS